MHLALCRSLTAQVALAHTKVMPTTDTSYTSGYAGNSNWFDKIMTSRHMRLVTLDMIALCKTGDTRRMSLAPTRLAGV